MKKSLLLIFLLCISTTAAIPNLLPEKYAGMVYVNDRPARVGSVISVEFDGVEIDSFRIIEPIWNRFNYVIDVYGVPVGSQLTWKYNGRDIGLVDYYEDGGFDISHNIYVKRTKRRR